MSKFVSIHLLDNKEEEDKKSPAFNTTSFQCTESYRSPILSQWDECQQGTSLNWTLTEMDLKRVFESWGHDAVSDWNNWL